MMLILIPLYWAHKQSVTIKMFKQTLESAHCRLTPLMHKESNLKSLYTQLIVYFHNLRDTGNCFSSVVLMNGYS